MSVWKILILFFNNSVRSCKERLMWSFMDASGTGICLGINLTVSLTIS